MDWKLWLGTCLTVLICGDASTTYPPWPILKNKTLHLRKLPSDRYKRSLNAVKNNNNHFRGGYTVIEKPAQNIQDSLEEDEQIVGAFARLPPPPLPNTARRRENPRALESNVVNSNAVGDSLFSFRDGDGNFLSNQRNMFISQKKGNKNQKHHSSGMLNPNSRKPNSLPTSSHSFGNRFELDPFDNSDNTKNPVISNSIFVNSDPREIIGIPSYEGESPIYIRRDNEAPSSTRTLFHLGGPRGGVAPSQPNDINFDSDKRNFDFPNRGVGSGGANFGSSNVGVGSNNVGFGSPQRGSGSNNVGFGTQQRGSGSNDIGFRTPHRGDDSSNVGFGTPQRGSDSHNVGFGTPQRGSDSHNVGFGTPQRGSGSNDVGFGTPQRGSDSHNVGFGTPQRGGGSNDVGFGTPQRGSDSHNVRFGTPQRGSGSNDVGFATPQRGSGSNNVGFGTPHRRVVGFGTPQKGLGSSSGGFEPPKKDFDSNYIGFRTPQNDFGSNNVGFGSSHSGFGPNDVGYETQKKGFGSNNVGFGTPQSDFGSNNIGFGSSHRGFSSNNEGFGSPDRRFESNNVGFEGPKRDYDSNNVGFGTPHRGFGSNNVGFGTPHRGFDSSERRFNFNRRYDSSEREFGPNNRGYDTPDHLLFELPESGIYSKFGPVITTIHGAHERPNFIVPQPSNVPQFTQVHQGPALPQIPQGSNVPYDDRRIDTPSIFSPGAYPSTFLPTQTIIPVSRPSINRTPFVIQVPPPTIGTRSGNNLPFTPDNTVSYNFGMGVHNPSLINSKFDFNSGAIPQFGNPLTHQQLQANQANFPANDKKFQGHFQANNKKFQDNPQKYRINYKKHQGNQANFRINDKMYQENPSNFQVDGIKHQANQANFQMNDKRHQRNPTNFEVNEKLSGGSVSNSHNNKQRDERKFFNSNQIQNPSFSNHYYDPHDHNSNPSKSKRTSSHRQQFKISRHIPPISDNVSSA